MKNKKIIIVISCLLVVVIICCAVGIIYKNNNSNSNHETNNTVEENKDNNKTVLDDTTIKNIVDDTKYIEPEKEDTSKYKNSINLCIRNYYDEEYKEEKYALYDYYPVSDKKNCNYDTKELKAKSNSVKFLMSNSIDVDKEYEGVNIEYGDLCSQRFLAYSDNNEIKIKNYLNGNSYSTGLSLNDYFVDTILHRNNNLIGLILTANYLEEQTYFYYSFTTNSILYIGNFIDYNNDYLEVAKYDDKLRYIVSMYEGKILSYYSEPGTSVEIDIEKLNSEKNGIPFFDSATDYTKTFGKDKVDISGVIYDIKEKNDSSYNYVYMTSKSSNMTAEIKTFKIGNKEISELTSVNGFDFWSVPIIKKLDQFMTITIEGGGSYGGKTTYIYSYEGKELYAISSLAGDNDLEINLEYTDFKIEGNKCTITYELPKSVLDQDLIKYIVYYADENDDDVPDDFEYTEKSCNKLKKYSDITSKATYEMDYLGNGEFSDKKMISSFKLKDSMKEVFDKCNIK